MKINIKGFKWKFMQEQGLKSLFKGQPLLLEILNKRPQIKFEISSDQAGYVHEKEQNVLFR